MSVEIQEDLERFQKDAEYFDQHRAELLQQYADHWVAVYHQRVVGAAKDPRRLIKTL